MPFNVEKIKTKASEKKVDFIIKLSLFSIIMVICILVIIFLFYNTAAVIVGVVSFFWLGYKLGETVKQSNPKMLFSREFSGTVESVRTNAPSRVRNGRGQLFAVNCHPAHSILIICNLLKTRKEHQGFG